MATHCFECHGPTKQESDVRVDLRAAAFQKGDGAALVVPGQPDASRLIQVIRYADSDIQMPPKGKLPDDALRLLTEWVQQGAVWPESAADAAASAVNSRDPAVARNTHWAYRPVKAATPPAVTHADRVQTPLDAFVLQKLEAKGLSLSAPTDRATLLRRVTMDLWGLPPTYEQVQAFVADPAPDAFAQAVDGLLAAPQYGERWGRHWLDVARYADTKGYVFTEEHRYPYAYTYRDYVVRAFNSDLPYDQFVVQQLAADQVDLQGEPRNLAALGYLTVGRRYLNNGHDIIDDRIDVVTRGLLGLTVTCARCHDHKFDPIPTEDYYSLYGVFQASFEPKDLPEIGGADESEAYRQFEAELQKRQGEYNAQEEKYRQELAEHMRGHLADYLQLVIRDTSPARSDGLMKLSGEEPRPNLVNRWKQWFKQGSGAGARAFVPWVQLLTVPADQFAARRDALIDEFQAKTAAGDPAAGNALVYRKLIEQRPAHLYDLARMYGELVAQVHREWQEKLKATPDAKQLDDPAAEELRLALYAEGSPALLASEDGRQGFNRAMRDKLTQLNRRIDELKVTSPGAPPRAMVMNDQPSPGKPRVFVRGNPGRPGNEVDRRFLAVLSPGERLAFQQGSGRLELAKAIVDPQNPLTARVIVNRIWQHHFGTGLVATSSDFGYRGEPPTNPELLDYLADYLVRNNWSIKSVHRLILNSAVYQQSSTDNPQARQVDPENRLLWAMPRQRVEFESLRDSMLAVSGRLNPELGGRPFDNLVDPGNGRRTVYALVNRNDLPGTFRSFDFPDPDSSAPARPQTTVPQQALFVLNSPFVIEQARAAARTAAPSDADRAAGVRQLFRQILSRDPSPEEAASAVRFVSESKEIPGRMMTAWEELAQVLMLTNEFVFID